MLTNDDVDNQIGSKNGPEYEKVNLCVKNNIIKYMRTVHIGTRMHNAHGQKLIYGLGCCHQA